MAGRYDMASVVKKLTATETNAASDGIHYPKSKQRKSAIIIVLYKNSMTAPKLSMPVDQEMEIVGKQQLTTNIPILLHKQILLFLYHIFLIKDNRGYWELMLDAMTKFKISLKPKFFFSLKFSGSQTKSWSTNHQPKRERHPEADTPFMNGGQLTHCFSKLHNFSVLSFLFQYNL